MAQLDVVDSVAINSGFTGATNNPDVVRIVSTTRSADSKRVTIQFYARAIGSAFVYLHDPAQSNPFAAVENILMQVQVFQRRASKPKDISLTRLLGKTFAINAPDAKSYSMDTTVTFSGSAVNPLSFFAGVTSGVNHVVVSSHGGVPTAADQKDAGKICMFVSGFKLENLRLDVGNVEDVFKTLKGKVAGKCVVWFGGCNIGMNSAFCKLAATASGCHVVAPVMPLTAQSFPKGHIDMLDGFAIPKIFKPDGNTLSASDFCALQENLKFSVPV